MKIKILYALCIVVVLVSCKKNFLDKGPDEDLTIDKAFRDRLNTERFHTSVYGYLPRDWFPFDGTEASPFIASTDEMVTPWEGHFVRQMNRGSWNSSNVPVNSWALPYRGIRQANIFLENVDASPITQEEKSLWSAEVIFLRAFYHYNLMKIFGPVPIIDHIIPSSADYTSIRRNTLEECVNFIVAECDKAGALLPIKVSDESKSGRVTKAAVLALKSRILLCAASPLWNGNPDYANFKDDEGVQLFPVTFSKEKWQIASDAAKQCIDECEQGGYGLYRSASNDPVKNYQELFLADWNKEVIFAYNYLTNDGLQGWPEKTSFPRGMGGWSGFAPTQDIVDAYEMANGQQPIIGYNNDETPIVNPSSGYQETGYATTAGPINRWPKGVRNMYVGRDPRFYASINYSGAFWITRPVEFWKTGLDGWIGEGYTKTGYLLKKFSDPSADVILGRFAFQTTNFFRLGEIYLNYAEALNEAQGAVPDVYKYINLIRDRAGMPPLPIGLSQNEMRDKVRHERRIELAFEMHRYFDAHRWKIAPGTEGSEIHGLSISAGTSLQDDSFYQRRTIEKRVFLPKHYLFPIPQSEINKTPGLSQNPGW